MSIFPRIWSVSSGDSAASKWNCGEAAHGVTQQCEGAGTFPRNVTVSKQRVYIFVFVSLVPGQDKKHWKGEGRMSSFPGDLSMALWVLFNECFEQSFDSKRRFFCTLLWYLLLFWHNNNILTFQGKYEVNVEIKNKEINSLKEELKSLQVLSSLFCSLFVFLSSVSSLVYDTPFRPDTTQVIYHWPHAWLLFNNLDPLHRH